MGSRVQGASGCATNRIYHGTRIKNRYRTKAEKLAEANARAQKQRGLIARCRGDVQK